jgi:hypothetical protein
VGNARRFWTAFLMFEFSVSPRFWTLTRYHFSEVEVVYLLASVW